jgi:hypothetical protein
MVVSFTPPPLYLQGRRHWYPLNRKLGEPETIWTLYGGEKSMPLLGIKHSDSSVVQNLF